MNSNKRGLVIFIAMLLVVVIAAGLSGQTPNEPFILGDSIAVVNVVGTIEERGDTCNHQWVL